MKVINYGNNFEIYGEDLKTFDSLPVHTYNVKFHPMMGFSLAKTNDFKQVEEKIYGDQERKIDKALYAFGEFQRSLGIILSGDKGIGKSLFTQLLAERCIRNGIPVILVDKAYEGIANFIDSIEQEVLVLFDEFEKVFDPSKDGIESQDALLGLFDGVSQHKRIYALTVNDLGRVNEFMLNRPGRFHYHLRFEYPNAEEVFEYLSDKVDGEYVEEIEKAVSFSRRVKLNYDCLRAIAFELNNGEPFKEAIEDLNIVNTEVQKYNLTVELTDEKETKIAPMVFKDVALDLFSDQAQAERFLQGEYASLTFDPKELQIFDDTLYCLGETAELYVDPDHDVYNSDMKVESITVTQAATKTYSYTK